MSFSFKIAITCIPVLLAALALGSSAYAQVYVDKVEVFDQGGLTSGATLGIDVIQGSCGTGTTLTSEPFFDTIISITVKNASSLPVTLGKLHYRLPDGGSKLRRKMGGLSPVSSPLVPAKSSAVVSYFLFKAGNSVKRTQKPVSVLPADAGFQNLSLTVNGRYANRRSLTLAHTFGVSIGNENRCAN